MLSPATHVAVAALLLTLLPACGRAGEIDTEHLFGFMLGSDVGRVGEREIQFMTAGLSRAAGKSRTLSQDIELEWTPAPDFRVELGTSVAAHDRRGGPGLDDRWQFGWQSMALDLRYRFLDRDIAPFGLTLAMETRASRIEESTGLPARVYGTELTFALDRELIPGTLVAALNLTYQPEWTRLAGAPASEQEATIGVATALMAQIRPGLLLGSEARYLRRYDGIGLQAFSGDALLVGPTAYLQLSERSRLTAAWSIQAWHRSGDALSPAGFERHQARLIYGINF